MNLMNILNTFSKRPRIAMISTHGYFAADPPLGAKDTGGQVVYVLELSRKLADLGYEVDIWTRRFEDQPKIDIVSDSVRIVRVPCGGPEFIPKEYLYESLPEWCDNALRCIAKNDLTYQFVNSHYWDAGLAGEHISDSLGIQHIHTPHSLGSWKRNRMETDFEEGSASLEQKYNFSGRIFHEKRIYDECDLLVPTTQLQEDVLTDSYGVRRDKCRMIPPGYDDNRFFPVSDASRRAIRKRLGFKGKVVLALGRLAANKGYDLLINAFGVVAERLPDARLHLAIGGDEMEPSEEKLLADLKDNVSARGLADKVVFSGWVQNKEIADHYRAADVFVLPSRYEPFGMTAIEAMACETPTVMTTHGGLYRTVTFGKHALYADPFDDVDLGITIFKALKHRRLKENIARMGSQKVRSLFTWSGIAQQLIAAVDHRPSGVINGNVKQNGHKALLF